MLKPINAILFATDLSPQCQQAYEFAVAMGIRNKALVYILYILEEMPESIESRIQGLVGRHQWQDLMQTKKEDVHKSLTGKRLSSQVLQEIQDFCALVGEDEDTCDFNSQEIIISAGDISETIMKNAEDNKCDIIVLGAHEGFVSRNSISDHIKTVLKRSSIPVIVVPAAVD